MGDCRSENQSTDSGTQDTASGPAQAARVHASVMRNVLFKPVWVRVCVVMTFNRTNSDCKKKKKAACLCIIDQLVKVYVCV